MACRGWAGVLAVDVNVAGLLLFLIAILVLTLLVATGRKKNGKAKHDAVPKPLPPVKQLPPVIVKRYFGSQARATELFHADSNKMRARGYFPTSQTWAAGQWGCAAFLFALVLCVILIGIIVFIYMIIVKPDGTLTVTYELRAQEKTCPQCAEEVKAAALICRFCGFQFSPGILDHGGR
jgi:hypothetical protein